MNEIIHGDAIHHVKTIPDDTIDLIFTDPPYNTTSLKLDKQQFDIKDYMAEFKRVLKPNGWFFCFSVFEMACIVANNGFRRKFEYVWEKPHLVPKTPDTVRPYYQHELIYAFIRNECKPSKLFFKPKALRTVGKAYTDTRKTVALSDFAKKQRINVVAQPTINTGYREGTTILRYNPKNLMSKYERTEHPTQKPLALCELIVRAYTPQDGTVYDPFAGSVAPSH